MHPKYPRTPYWPDSPGQGRASERHDCPARFVGPEVVVTEKIDGGNTMIHRGEVYARSVSAPSRASWMAMVRKHTAWKVQEDDLYLYGEDIYAVHSIEYDPVFEDRTFFAFALRRGDRFASFAEVESYAASHDIPLVPVLYRGCFDSLPAVRSFLEHALARPSALGGVREGLVLRMAGGFPASDFAQNVCKSVRPNHVQTQPDWRRQWRRIKTLPLQANHSDGSGA